MSIPIAACGIRVDSGERVLILSWNHQMVFGSNVADSTTTGVYKCLGQGTFAGVESAAEAEAIRKP